MSTLQGFGTDTPAGRGGSIIRVTTLASSGPGSLREALDFDGPRVIVFEVAGNIWPLSDLQIRNPFVTIAGQTAPSPGITIAGPYSVRLRTHDALIQHLRIRVGDGEASNTGASRDGLSILGSSDGSVEAYNVVIDHCSISWAIDENVEIWYANVHDVTVRQCIISEGLHDSIHPQGPHSMGFLVGDRARRVAVIGNLFAHNARRNPAPFGDTSTLIVNNVIYNAKELAIHYADHNDSGPLESSAVGNVIVTGPDSGGYADRIFIHPNVTDDSQFYLLDNDAPSEPYVGAGILLESPSIWCDPLTVRPSGEVLEWVLANTGARPWDRDDVDERIISDVRSGTGRIIDSQNDVGGWPDLTPTSRPLDLPADPWGDDDGDGICNFDEWLTEMEGETVIDFEGSVLDAVQNVQAALDDLQAQVAPSKEALAAAIATLQAAQIQLNTLDQAIVETRARLAG